MSRAREPVVIRLTGPSELDSLVDLWVESWQATMPAIDFAARRAWLVDHLAELAIGGAETWVAAEPEHGRPIGFLTLFPATGYIDQLVVALRFWGSGAASALIARARLRSPARLSLKVNADNARAVRFYEREGFRRTGQGINPRSGLPIHFYEWSADDAAPS